MARTNGLSLPHPQEVRELSRGSGRFSIKNLLNHKTVLLLSFVLVMNSVVSFLVLRSDLFIHGDLYTYGLVYSVDWAGPYWNLTTTLWIFLGGAIILTGAAIVPHYLYSRKVSRFSTWAGVLLPVLALSFEGVGIFYLTQKNSIVWNTLPNYGVQFITNWATTYNLISVPALVLMVASLLALLVPVIRATGYEIQITSE